MAVKKITLSEVTKKHIRVIAFLVVSAVLAYTLSLITDKPEALYFAPLINYLIFAVEKELAKDGYIRAIKER